MSKSIEKQHPWRLAATWVIGGVALAAGCGGLPEEDPAVAPSAKADTAEDRCRVGNCYSCTRKIAIFSAAGACYMMPSGTEKYIWAAAPTACNGAIRLCGNESTAVPESVPSGVEAIQQQIDAEEYDAAISAAIDHYDIDCSTVTGGARGVRYDPAVDASLGRAGRAKRDGTVGIGVLAFRSPAGLAMTIYHETIHTAQRAEGRIHASDYDTQWKCMNEAEAYKKSLDWALELNPPLDAAIYNPFNDSYWHYYRCLTPTNQGLFNRGEYEIQLPPCGGGLSCTMIPIAGVPPCFSYPGPQEAYCR